MKSEKAQKAVASCRLPVVRGGISNIEKGMMNLEVRSKEQGEIISNFRSFDSASLPGCVAIILVNLYFVSGLNRQLIIHHWLKENKNYLLKFYP